ncbi:putative amino acid permease [Mycobacterium heckeshornense]|uniref:Putative amino acid permease n=1 Tax=Mycobacterium heckeshornense TaxID=110505 RepID=A0A7R7JFZ8_9MYCO|nr:putative amino acid permease [Mycobacterium heckeshornense]
MNVPKPGTVTADVGYQRGLSARTVQMMAIGGAIGTGLFYGAGGGIEQAGPALILAYVVGGLAIFVVMRALGELLVYRPVSGSMSEYAEEFLGRLVGFANGWTYWAVWTTTCMAEITVAGKYVRFWLPAIPEWVTALTVLAILFAANLISVRIFGEAEFWFSLIKVAAIVGIIIVGIAVLLPIPTIGPPAGPTVANLWNDGGIFPTGFSRALLSLQTVVFAYVGVELVGVTAGEAENPKVTLRKAINTLPLRIGLFYVGALLVILSVRGWRHFHSGQSPFVAVFKYIDIPAAAGIVNFILLTAALSSCNAGIYSTGRMVHSLSERGEAPAALQALSSRHVPLPAIAFSALVMGLGVFVQLAFSRACLCLHHLGVRHWDYFRVGLNLSLASGVSPAGGRRKTAGLRLSAAGRTGDHGTGLGISRRCGGFAVLHRPWAHGDHGRCRLVGARRTRLRCPSRRGTDSLR